MGTQPAAARGGSGLLLAGHISKSWAVVTCWKPSETPREAGYLAPGAGAEELEPPSMGTPRLNLVPHAALAAHRYGAAAWRGHLALSVTILAVAKGGQGMIYISSVLLLGFGLRREGSPSSSIILVDGSNDFAGGLSGNTVQVTALLQAGNQSSRCIEEIG